MAILFVSGTDTDAGKTVATGSLARLLIDSGIQATTHKAVQTGCTEIASDIVDHRQLMGIPVQDYDKNGESCTYIFNKPCSPHLAAELENREIVPSEIISSVESLSSKFELCLCEGAGGLMVPLTRSYTTFDLLKETQWPVILVCSSKLGSINHSLLSIENIFHNKLNLHTLIYNHHPADDMEIMNDSKSVIMQHLQNRFPSANFYELTMDKKIIGFQKEHWV